VTSRTRTPLRRLAALAPLAALVTSACFATRSDVRILQDQIGQMRAEMARRDSARAREAAEAMQHEAMLLGVIVDSMRAANARAVRWQSNAQTDLRAMQEQLLQIQELTGQVPARIRELRADMESRNQTMPAATPTTGTTPGDTTRGAAAAPPAAAAPGPNQMYQIATDQIRRGSYATARTAFSEFLTTYPAHELAPDAQLGIAETYAAERNEVAADSVYKLVVQRYPRSQRAATALYKRGVMLRNAGKADEARAAFQQIVRDYPRSDEATLAQEALRGRG
jgi:tol-pal system protein YbgF